MSETQPSNRSRRRSSINVLRSEYSDQIIKSNNLAENKLAIEAKHFEKAKQQTCRNIENEQQALQTLLQQQTSKRRLSLPVIRVETARERLIADQGKLFEKCKSFSEETRMFTSSEKLPITEEETGTDDELNLQLENTTHDIRSSNPDKLGQDKDTSQRELKGTNYLDCPLTARPHSSPDKPAPPNTLRKNALSKGSLTASMSNINKEMTLTVPTMTASRSAEHLTSCGRTSPRPDSGGKTSQRRWSDETKPKIGSLVVLPSLPRKSSLTSQKY